MSTWVRSLCKLTLVLVEEMEMELGPLELAQQELGQLELAQLVSVLVLVLGQGQTWKQVLSRVHIYLPFVK